LYYEELLLSAEKELGVRRWRLGFVRIAMH
jgi:hypothetical protein